MGAAARSFLSRISPLFWVAAVALVIAHLADGHLHMLGWVIIATGMGTAGTVSGAITATAGHDKALLLTALVANQPPAAEGEQEHPVRDFRAV